MELLNALAERADEVSRSEEELVFQEKVGGMDVFLPSRHFSFIRYMSGETYSLGHV